VLEARGPLLGKKHPDTLTAMGNLAKTLYAQRDLAGAHKLQEQVLEARVRLLGKEHPDTLTAMHNLAQTLKAQGDLAGARKLQEQVLEAWGRLFGKEHPDTLTAVNNLAAAKFRSKKNPIMIGENDSDIRTKSSQRFIPELTR
jgi:Tetratricopeptide repeat